MSKADEQRRRQSDHFRAWLHGERAKRRAVSGDVAPKESAVSAWIRAEAKRGVEQGDLFAGEEPLRPL